jgi:hypothetical protein
MLRVLAAAFAAFAIWGVAAPNVAEAQEWNDARTRALVEQATRRRAEQLADTGLVDYKATARGFLTFLAQVGAGFPDPPKIVKADELALEVYWRAPNLSKQRIVGRRDTLLLPTDINYHRDHLGIVQNNFPSVIRLGDGDEVRDVPHPLSDLGLAAYDYAIADSLRISLPDRTIEVFEVRVRPRDDRGPAAVGAVYIDRVDAQVVRMALSFTRSALKDKQLEDVSVVLENALIENRFWLPRRQEIEIRRTGSWLDYPARGIIRGRWEICCYEVNRGFDPGFFGGPEIVQAPRAEQARHAWSGSVLDSLPEDIRAATDEDVREVQEEARRLVRAEALARTRASSLAARAISDFIRVNRVEGLALGLGVVRQFGGGISGTLAGRYGFEDREPKATISLGWRRADGVGVQLRGYRDYRDVSDEPETSTLRNSIAAQEFGSDYTQPYDTRGVALAAELGTRFGGRWSVEGSHEWQDPLAVRATPSRGRYEATIPAVELSGPRLALTFARPPMLAPFGAELRARGELRAGLVRPGREGGSPGASDEPGSTSFGRLYGSVAIERPFGTRRLVLRSALAVAAGADLPPQEFVYVGGPTTGPGYRFHQFVGRAAASQRVEWRFPTPFVAIPLGRFGGSTRSATLAPYAHAVYLARPASFGTGRQGWHPSLGLGFLGLFDLLRFDVARGTRDGRWTFSVDVSSDFWAIL